MEFSFCLLGSLHSSWTLWSCSLFFFPSWCPNEAFYLCCLPGLILFQKSTCLSPLVMLSTLVFDSLSLSFSTSVFQNLNFLAEFFFHVADFFPLVLLFSHLHPDFFFSMMLTFLFSDCIELAHLFTFTPNYRVSSNMLPYSEGWDYLF